jgi:hypothetical protein
MVAGNSPINRKIYSTTINKKHLRFVPNNGLNTSVQGFYRFYVDENAPKGENIQPMTDADLIVGEGVGLRGKKLKLK